MKGTIATLFALSFLAVVTAAYEACGVQRRENEHPWLFKVVTEGNGYSSFWAVLISEDSALTSHSYFGSYEDVKQGRVSARAEFEANGTVQTIEITEIKKFGPKIPGSMVNLALLKLASPVDTDIYTPICLPNSKPGMGYGAGLRVLQETIENNKRAIREIQVQQNYFESCKREYLESKYQYEIEPDKMCVVGDKEIVCDGTSLGMLVQKKDYRYYITGTLAVTLCEPNFQSSVYTRVYDFNNQISEMSNAQSDEVTLMPLLEGQVAVTYH